MKRIIERMREENERNEKRIRKEYEKMLEEKLIVVQEYEEMLGAMRSEIELLEED
jgi:endonuclease III-like uncharacterized protein